jgi:hypothetical protein
VRGQIRKNTLIYQDKPRLKTALELLRTSMDVEDSLSEVLRLSIYALAVSVERDNATAAAVRPPVS